jgi:hypothetical protein
MNDYNGPLNLSGVTIIDGSISTSGMRMSIPGLTSIVMDDIVLIGDINLYDAPALASVSMAKLETAGDIVLMVSSPISLDFPSLRNVSSISAVGNFSR